MTIQVIIELDKPVHLNLLSYRNMFGFQAPTDTEEDVKVYSLSLCREQSRSGPMDNGNTDS